MEMILLRRPKDIVRESSGLIDADGQKSSRKSTGRPHHRPRGSGVAACGVCGGRSALTADEAQPPPPQRPRCYTPAREKGRFHCTPKLWPCPLSGWVASASCAWARAAVEAEARRRRSTARPRQVQDLRVVPRHTRGVHRFHFSNLCRLHHLFLVAVLLLAAFGLPARADTLVTTPRGDEWHTREQPWVVDPGSAEVKQNSHVGGPTDANLCCWRACGLRIEPTQQPGEQD